MAKIIDKSGIYCISNIINNNYYIGSAVNLRLRKKEHLNTLRKNKHHNKRLQKDWNEFGENAFLFDHLELVEKENLIEREQWYIDFLKPYYNILRVAGSRLGLEFSEETKRLMSEKAKGRKASEETKKKLSEARKGRKISSEQLKKLRIGLINANIDFSGEKNPFYGKTHSEELKQRFSINKKNDPKHKKMMDGIYEKNKTRFKGEKNPFYGKKHSEETKKLLSEQRKGKEGRKGWKMTEEQKKLISEKNKGRKASDETKKLISEKGKGRVFSETHRARLTEANLRRWAKIKQNKTENI